MSKRLRRLLVALILLFIAGMLATWLVYAKLDRSPGELLRYIEHRLEGHPKLEALALPVIGSLRPWIEHPVPTNLPSLGKGAQAQVYATQDYDTQGKPIPALRGDGHPAATGTVFMVATGAELRAAMARARPGQIIELLPGTIGKSGNFKTGAAGTAAQPIVVRAAIPGTATIEFLSTVGFDVNQPYWVFENLVLRGVCADDGECEHAFHVFGPARGTVIRNNRLENFNAQIKVNGLDGAWPDAGLIEGNTLINARPRRTHFPVTPVDIVGANDWTLADNLVSNFVKASGNGVSFGMFVKGAGRGAVIERNLVVCSPEGISLPGVRVGISVGGGGTEARYCRDRRCETEHTAAIVRNNIVAHCNDSGIDVNRSNQTLIVHNTLINTAGISMRQTLASARIEANRFDGSIHVRDGALMDAADNAGTGAFTHADALDLHWQGTPTLVPSLAEDDFCARPRGERSPQGAVSDIDACTGVKP